MARGISRDSKKESFWREMVRGQSGSGLSVRAWCRRQALRESAFYGWRRRLGLRDGGSLAPFVPVRVVEDAVAVGAVAGRIEIVLAAERRVLVIGPVDRRALADVLAVLTRDVLAGEAGARSGRGEADSC